MLLKARKHLVKVMKMAAPWWYLEGKKTLALFDGYHELANLPVGDARKTRVLPVGCYERSS